MASTKIEDVAIGKAAAEKILAENCISSPPVLILELAETYGLAVFKANFEDDKIAGYIDFDNKRIVVNKEHSLGRQNFSIAHELGHWIMHYEEVKSDQNEIRILYRRPIDGETDRLEVQANSFAAYLLVPEEMFEKHKKKDDLELAMLFNVSQSTIGFRRKNHDG
jgi:Zn-dependent peptidase ImmA (M78 family)